MPLTLLKDLSILVLRCNALQFSIIDTEEIALASHHMAATTTAVTAVTVRVLAVVLSCEVTLREMQDTSTQQVADFWP